MGRCLQGGNDRAPHLESRCSHYVSPIVCVRIVAIVTVNDGGRVERGHTAGDERFERDDRDRHDLADCGGAE